MTAQHFLQVANATYLKYHYNQEISTLSKYFQTREFTITSLSVRVDTCINPQVKKTKHQRNTSYLHYYPISFPLFFAH